MVTPDSKLRDAVGGASAKKLETAFGMETVRDLLHHLPRRYQERGELTDLAKLVEGEVATVWARVVRVATRTGQRKDQRRKPLTITDVTITDGRNSMTLTFFNQPFRNRQLAVGTAALFAGKVGRFREKWQLTNPEVNLVDDAEQASAMAGALIPIYPATAAVSSWQIAKAVRVALDVVDLPASADPLPVELRARQGLQELGAAYRCAHFPAEHADYVRARRRLAWDEAMVVQTVLAQRRSATQRTPATARPPRRAGIAEAFDAGLPFELTAGQREIGSLIRDELGGSRPMHRLLQGEVGSGKTLIAARAMLQVVDAGGQAALLAPTEVLAQQHARALRQLMGPLGRAGELDAADPSTAIALVTGSLTSAQRRAALADIASGAAGLVVGTHALLEPTVGWHDLGLVVVDEQHRFGVEQRDALRQRTSGGAAPHVLVMTATPIPRTVAMTVFGDLDVSSLTELPRGRQAIRTSVIPVEKPAWTARMWERVRAEVHEGHRAFVVCPRIAPGDLDQDQGGRAPGAALEDVLPALQADQLAGLRLAPLHGRLPAEDKDLTMRAFAAGRVDVLVATTVIEVGVDVPEATVMVVLDADRFGVSQLHQLRGRVGRGSAASWCLLQTSAPLDTPARERVEAVAGTLDGAVLARIDLEQRREGDVLGAAQSGRRKTLRVLDLLRHEDIIVAARTEAAALVAADPTLADYPALLREVTAALTDSDAAYLEKG